MNATGPRVSVAAPQGLRWATGGGSRIGDCNGFHLALPHKRGTICGRYGPETPPNPSRRVLICGSCARIAGVERDLNLWVGDDIDA